MPVQPAAILAAVLLAASAASAALSLEPPLSQGRWMGTASHSGMIGRTKRSTYHIIEDCMTVSSEEGQYLYKSKGPNSDQLCGLYLMAPPDKMIFLHIDYLNVPCEQEGLVVIVDGWEMNGDVFPGVYDHAKTRDERFHHFCGGKSSIGSSSSVLASQNAALVMYRVPPIPGAGFSIRVRHIKSHTPCHVLIEGGPGDGISEVHTLRNYGKRNNCSITVMAAARIEVLAMNVGVPNRRGFRGLETGTLHKCEKRGLNDFVEIGGSMGIDSSQLIAADSICGLDSEPGNSMELVNCFITTIRLVSSGLFDNSVTVAFRKLEDLDEQEPPTISCFRE